MTAVVSSEATAVFLLLPTSYLSLIARILGEAATSSGLSRILWKEINAIRVFVCVEPTAFGTYPLQTLGWI